MIIIRKDTVWGPGEGFMYDDVQIAEGVTLTIAPGAQIQGNGHKIEAYGKLNAVGTANNPIFISNAHLGLSNDIYSTTSKINLEHVHLDGGTLSGISHDVFGSVRMLDSVVTNLGQQIYSAYDEYNGRSIFDGNVFLNSYGIRATYGTSPIISNNVFDRYDDVTSYYDFKESDLAILTESNENGTGPHSYGNAFLALGKESIRLDGNYGIIDTDGDYYGTTDKKIIEKMIHDNNDDLKIGNEVNLSSISRTASNDLPRSLFSFTSILLPRDIIVDARLFGLSNIDVTGNKLNNTLTGNGGNNTIDGGLGADTMIGGAGNDTYIVDNARDVTIENSGKGYDRVVASVSYTLANNVEMLTLSGAKAINATGNALANHLVGNGAANVLDGKGGADVMEGGAGNDVYRVDHASDRVFESVGEGKDTVLTTVSYRLAAGQQIEVLQSADPNGTAALNLTGNEFANKLVGNAGNNVLDGGGGIDEMHGRAGNDTYYVDNARDVVVEAVGAGTDTIFSTVSYTLQRGHEIENLRLNGSTGYAGLNLTGNEFGQSLVGNNGANVLDGKGGADVMDGRGGSDTFVFATTLGANNVDRVVDFTEADTIRLSKSIFTALAPGQLTAAEFKDIAKAKVDADDHILYDSRNGSLFYDADGSGKAAAVKFAVLDNKAAITHADFLIA